MISVGSQVKVGWGRNAGQIGTVTHSDAERQIALVNWGKIAVSDSFFRPGDRTVDDSYWAYWRDIVVAETAA